ncbi:MAG: hypothetical protein AB7V50_03105 [Vampirovibrionia bacterium]
MDYSTSSHETHQFHYKILNVNTSEILAESDYYDYLEILKNALIELHKGLCDTSKIVIIKEVVKK